MKNNKKGFTLVELVIVVAVMAVLVAVAIPTVSSIINSAETSVAQSNAKTIESMIKLAQAEADGKTLSDKEVDAALTAAKLGVDGIFIFDITSGTVSPAPAETTTAPEADAIEYTQMYITFNSDAAATEEVKEGDNVTVPAQTAEQNSVLVVKGTLNQPVTE